MTESLWELRLTVASKAEGYTACWIAPGEQVSESFDLMLPIDEDAAISLRWYFEDYLHFPGAGDRKHAEGIEKNLENWGRALFEALFAGRLGGSLEQQIEQMLAEDRSVVLTLGSDDPKFHAQPWEMLRTSRGPFAFRGVSVRRQLVGRRSVVQPRFALPLRVLLIVSRPDEAGFIDPRNSIRPLFEALENWPENTVDIEFCEPPTLQRLEEMISGARKEKRPFHIVHFDGHGKYLPETGVGALAFESDEEGKKAHLVPGRALGDLLSQIEIPLVLLEACRGSALSDRPIYSSVAPALLAAGVGSVVAFSHSVHVEGARILVQRLYRELIDGGTVGEALGEARKAMFADRRRWVEPGPDGEVIELEDWGIAQLYQVGEDPALIAPERDASGPVSGLRIRREWRERFLGDFPPEPMYAFHGRAAELLKLERLFRSSIGVLVSGMGGMGKTALSREAAAWWLRTGRFETAIFHSFERKAGVVDVVRGIGKAFEGEDFLSRPPAEQRRRAKGYFQTRKLLLIWDNFESTLAAFQKGDLQIFDDAARDELNALFQEFTEGEPVGRILVTCRPEATGLNEIGELSLRGLWRTDSLHLLASILKKRGISTDVAGWERERLHELLETAADHPLSISLIAPHLGLMNPTEVRDALRTDLFEFTDEGALESRNRSLQASLEFSQRRLSEKAKKILSYLTWFEGGVFEKAFTDFALLDEDEWQDLRREFEATSLLRVENIEWSSSQYLHLHPTLPYIVNVDAAEDVESIGIRFFDVCMAMTLLADESLHGTQPASGMALMKLEEANIRSALDWAMQRGVSYGLQFAETLSLYYERSGRLREHNLIADVIIERFPRSVRSDAASCTAIWQKAKSLVSGGEADEAIAALNELIEQLKEGRGENFLLATSYSILSAVYVSIHRPRLSVPIAEHAISLLSNIPGESAQTNLASTLGDLSNALTGLGRLEEALARTQEALKINLEQNNKNGIALDLGRIALIYTKQKRWAEAEEYYGRVLRLASTMGDLKLQGVTHLNWADLHRKRGDLVLANQLCKKALLLFQRANDQVMEMRACNLLGSIDEEKGRFDAAEAWYGRSYEVAKALGDIHQKAGIKHNLGVLHKRRARLAGNISHRGHLNNALDLITQSLEIWLKLNDQVNAAASLFQLGDVYRHLGELDQADDFLVKSLEIYESLGLPEVSSVYLCLSLVSQKRGDNTAAAVWRKKYRIRTGKDNVHVRKDSEV